MVTLGAGKPIYSSEIVVRSYTLAACCYRSALGSHPDLGGHCPRSVRADG
jgi:hypothetical protein